MAARACAAVFLASLLEVARGLAATARLQGELGAEASSWAASAAPAAEGEAPGPLGACAGYECVERYIDLPDQAYEWHELADQLMQGALEGVAWKGHVLALTSQSWLGQNETSRRVWSHPMVVVVPENLDTAVPKVREWATLIVGGAHQLQDTVQPDVPDVQAAVYMAVHTRAVAVALLQVPNQPLTFGADPAGLPRKEDEIKAFTWRHFEEHKRPEWLIELPNAKATVRAMDAAAEFSEELGLSVRRFGVTGCSKRATAALMACGHDPRCEMLMPCSMTGSIPKLYQLMMQSLGNPASALLDYWENRVFAEEDAPETPELFDIVDAHNYTHRLTMPKLWLNAASDDFFPADHTSLFWSELPGQKYLFQKESSPHVGTLEASNFLSPAAAFTNAILLDRPLPEVDWSIDDTTGDIVARRLGGEAPLAATVWSARTCGGSPRRDFRLTTADQGLACARCGVQLNPMQCNVTRSTRWTKREVLDAGSSAWRVSVPAPSKGWEAFFVTFEFSSPRPGSDPLSISTGVSVVPVGHLPFPACHGAGCRGQRLVLAATA